DTAPEVYERVCQATVDVVIESCPGLEAGAAPRISQDYSTGSFTCSRGPADGEIDWTRSTGSIYNQGRALTAPYPGAFTLYNGRKVMIWSARPMENPPVYVGRTPGRVIGREGGEVHVLTGDGVLRVIEVSCEGASKVPAAEVLTSVRTTLGLH